MVACNFSQNFTIYAAYKIDSSTNKDGSDVKDADVFATGMKYAF